MKPLIGIDIVDVGKFEQTLSDGGDAFRERCFHESEVGTGTAEHLAGIFAAKEAVIKSLSLSPGSWKEIRISKLETGKPVAEYLGDEAEFKESDLSVSHDRKFAVASFIAFH